VVDVERWAELRREHFVRGISIRELGRRYEIDRNTVRRALRASDPPHKERRKRPSKLDPYKETIHELLRADPRLTGVRIHELIEPLGYRGSRTILDEYLREVRPLFVPTRTFQRTTYRRGEICQFDLWQPASEVPVGHGQTRRGYVVVACMGYSRAGAGALVFTREAADILWGVTRCIWSLGGLPGTLVWDREGALHAGQGRPTDVYAAFCGQLKLDWHFCGKGDPQAKGAVEKLQQYFETNFEPGRMFANHLDFQLQLDGWFEKANARLHRRLRERPIDRLAEEHEVMRDLPAWPDVQRRWVMRVPPDPYLRFDTNDYSLDPGLVARRVEVRVTQQRVIATALDTGEVAASHERSFAKHRTITALEHARSLKALRTEHSGAEIEVQQRSLDVYDALIA
jgi:transposase